MEDQLHTILEVREQIKLELIKVIEFEEKLARISPQRLEMLRPDMLTPYSIEKLSSEFPFLNWNDFFDSALHTALDEGKLTPGFYLFSLISCIYIKIVLDVAVTNYYLIVKIRPMDLKMFREKYFLMTQKC